MEASGKLKGSERMIFYMEMNKAVVTRFDPRMHDQFMLMAKSFKKACCGPHLPWSMERFLTKLTTTFVIAKKSIEECKSDENQDGNRDGGRVVNGILPYH